jgi:hypothetical protein
LRWLTGSGNNGPRHVRKINLVWFVGLLLVGMGVLLNEWLLAFLFSSHGIVDVVDLLEIRIFDVGCIVLGSATLALRRPLAQDRIVVRLLRAYPRASAVWFGLVTAACTLLVGEMAVRTFAFWKPVRPDEVSTTTTTLDGRPHPDAWVGPDDRLGYKPTPNVTVVYRLNKDGKPFRTTTFSFDGYSRRVTPVEPLATRTRHALFFGDSFTFGELVESHETLPYYVGTLAREYTPYNYGFRGYGPQQMLEQLRTGEIRDQVKEPNGIAVYTAIDQHIGRAIGSMSVSLGLGSSLPYYVIEGDGTLTRRGSFATGRPWIQLTYRLLGPSRLLSRFGVDFPVRTTSQHLELLVRIIEEARSQYVAKFPGDRFYVLIYPGSKVLVKILPMLEAKHIAFLDYSRLFDKTQSEYWIQGDGHPTALGHQVVANRLFRDLQLSGEGTRQSPVARGATHD